MCASPRKGRDFRFSIFESRLQNSKFPFVLVLVLVLVLGVPGVFEGENEKELLRRSFCNRVSKIENRKSKIENPSLYRAHLHHIDDLGTGGDGGDDNRGLAATQATLFDQPAQSRFHRLFGFVVIERMHERFHAPTE